MHKAVDRENWNREDVFRFFRPFEDPFFNVTVTLDVTVLVSLCKKQDLSFSAACLFFSQRAVNQIPEFRFRLKDGELIEYASVEATQTVLLDNESFAFCHLPAADDLVSYVKSARESIAHYKRLRSFDVKTERLDLIYYTVLPWLEFTSFKHATRSNPDQTVPRIAIGKYSTDGGGRIKIPVSVEVNHAIMDGIHLGKYVSLFQKELDECEAAI
jgi:chloramphenicol O-acetyltransferase type A